MNREHVHEIWGRVAKWRRIVLLVLLLVPTFFASGYMASVLPHKGTVWHEIALIIVFTVLFAWISMGFWTALVGFLTLCSRYNRFYIPGSRPEQQNTSTRLPRTAILVPVCNEDSARVFAGIAAIYKSLEQTGKLDRFDFFVLSDTSDPDLMVEEELIWDRTCRMLNAHGRLFYRRRKLNVKRKSGNIADFCRRWGKSYTYMIVLDADSIMCGATMVRMVEIMEQHPEVGILQTAPRGVGKESLIARMQQFANNVYGPIFNVGLHFWQLGDAHFWGHNAIIRIEPFMQHCALDKLPGKPPLGGEIMSHDFVEAALMRRAGWAVWLAFDLGGSYEEMPPTLLDELKRDRRWCQGNLQHLRLLFTKGLCPVHRALFLNGAFSYISALLWFFFLTLCTIAAVYQAFYKPVYFPPDRTLFPNWPVWKPQWTIVLLGFTAVILFMPKVLAVLFILMQKGAARLHGGAIKLFLSTLLEIIFSTLLAPVRMLFHSKFVFVTLLGGQVGWAGQQRGDRETSWRDAVRFHWGGTVLAILWGGCLFIINRTFFWWLTPILTGLALSIPLCVVSSKVSWGRALRRAGFLLIPEEVEPPQEVLWLREHLATLQKPSPMLALPEVQGFARAVVEPFVNALHLKILRSSRRVAGAISKRRRALVEKALNHGPQALSRNEKRELLSDPDCLSHLHQAVWELSDPARATQWGLPE